MPNKYNKGEKVKFKKKHPCGGDTWEIIRVGMDFKLECRTCGRVVSMSRKDFEKAVKEKINEN
ncbi:MAG TPA: DUF951 domain-containing protein [Halanaerobiales bacterium]|nr:DUF951 domain-containing protein [Halanaerobiales bacterium]